LLVIYIVAQKYLATLKTTKLSIIRFHVIPFSDYSSPYIRTDGLTHMEKLTGESFS